MLTDTPWPLAGWRPSGWAVAGTVGVMTVLCALVLVGSLDDRGPGNTALVVDVVVGVIAIALVPVFFRHPVPAAVVLTALAAIAPTATPPATAGTFVVARTRSLPVAAAVAGAGVAGHVVRGLWLPVSGLSFGWWVVLSVIAHAALLAAGALSQARTNLVLGFAARARRAEADRDRDVAEAVSAERTRIAREMHDVVAHRLSLLATYAGAVEYRPDTPPEKLARAVGVVRSGAHQALEELRDVVGVLREAPGDGPVPPPSPGADRIADLVREAREAGEEIDVDFTLDGNPPGIVSRTVYRLAQEGLTNARKHAPGLPVRLQISGRPTTGIDVTLTNPTKPGQTADLPGAGAGLVGLTERVRIIGGRLEHGPDDAGFRLSAWLPWQL